MISQADLKEAIAECEGQRNPNANTCIKLAAFYAIQQHLYGTTEPEPTYSYAPPPVEQYDSGTEFSEAVKGRDLQDLMPVFDEIMTALSVYNPHLYKQAIRKLEE